MTITKNRKKLSSALLLVASLGCGADGQGTDEVTDDDGAVIEKMEELGFERDSLQLLDDRVIVEGDVVYFRDKLLNGEYAPPASNTGDSNKGYRHPSTITAAVQNIKLTFTAATSTTIRNAFINAAGDINSVPQSRVVISQNNTGPTLTVAEITPGLWSFTPCVADEPACTTPPTSGGIGSTIYIKAPGFTPGCANWTSSALAFVTRHELLHALGFTHVKQAGSIHIPDSGVCPNSATSCADATVYATVMKKTLVIDTPSCNASAGIPLVLQTDDRRSLEILYP